MQRRRWLRPHLNRLFHFWKDGTRQFTAVDRAPFPMKRRECPNLPVSGTSDILFKRYWDKPAPKLVSWRQDLRPPGLVWRLLNRSVQGAKNGISFPDLCPGLLGLPGAGFGKPGFKCPKSIENFELSGTA